VPNPAEIITAIASALKPGGWAFFSTINRTPKAFVQAIVGAEHILKLIPKGTHHYEMLIQPAELANWSRAVGLEVCSSRGIRYNPLFKRFSLTSSLSVNYLLAARKHNV